MKGTHTTLQLLAPVKESSAVSPSPPPCPGHAPSSDAKEEAPAGMVQAAQALGDSSELIVWLSKLGLLWSGCRGLVEMGNQQGRRSGDPESWRLTPASPRIHIPHKRRRRAEGPDDTGDGLHRLEVQQTSSSAAFEDERRFMCTPAARRRRLAGTVREERRAAGDDKNLTLLDLQPPWRAKISDQRPSDAPAYPPTEQTCFHTDSEADLSDYDNETNRSTGSDAQTSDATRDSTEAARPTHEGTDGDETSSHLSCDKNKTNAAARRVMRKIEEVENIIRHVGVTSSGWIKGDGGERDGPPPLSGARLGDGLRRWQAGGPLKAQEQRSKDDKAPLVEEFRALGEALSQSLQQVLRMEGVKKEWRPPKAQTKVFADVKKSLLESIQQPPGLTSDLLRCSTAPDGVCGSSSNPSAALDVPPRTSSSFGGTSAISSPPLQLSVTVNNQRDESCDEEGSAEESDVPWRWNQTHRRLRETDASEDDLLLSGKREKSRVFAADQGSIIFDEDVVLVQSIFI